MEVQTIIGLEVHVQLLTRTKIFCGCSTAFHPDRPNVQTCPVCLGLPGSLPVMNRRAFELGLKTAVALNCQIAEFTKWDRKQYYYPDLPKGYQISQYDLPFSTDGFFDLKLGDESGETRRVRIIRAHLEEDAGKNFHDETGRGTESHVDLNRAGTPLLEVVTQPDLRSPAEARRFLEELVLLLTYLEVSDCNMQEGSLRADANINLHIFDDEGRKIPTPITEIKNVNSFRFLEMALEYEARRQLEQWKATGKKLGEVPKETRGFDPQRNVTLPQRGKEEAADYRYFPDPDLVPVIVSADEIEAARQSLCEFPAARRERIAVAYGISYQEAAMIVDQGARFADYFEEVALGCGDGKAACNWITQDLLREWNERRWTLATQPLSAAALTALLRAVLQRTISIKSGRELLSALLDEGANGSPPPARVAELIQERGLALVEDSGAIDRAVAEVLGRNAKIVADVKAGKLQAVGPLVGQVMKLIKGADPARVREAILQRIQES